MPRDSAPRREEILRLATSSRGASVDDLAMRFGVTASTIRRDLARLTQAGKLARTYGGAIPVGRPEQSLTQWFGEAHEAKRSISRWAADHVQPGASVLLDAGSTVAALAFELRGHKGISVATGSLDVIHELRDVEGVRLDSLGGRLRPLSQAFVGPVAEAALERMSFDSAFLGADGVSAERGICEADLEQSRLKELMAKRADRVFVLVHAAKIGATPFPVWAVLPRLWTLVTDAGVRAEQLAPFTGSGIEIVVVAPDGTQLVVN